MKKLLVFLLTVAMLFGIVGCVPPPRDENTYVIGICNYVDTASLNQIVDSISTRLTAIFTEKGVSFDIRYDNCNMDNSVLSQIVSNFKSEKVDVMVGVATPVVVVMQAETDGTDLPVIFSAVSDPVGSGILENAAAPEGNITGTSDYLNTNAILDVAFAVKPEAKKVGLLYDVGQDSSAAPIRDAKAYLDQKGIAYVERTGTTINEVMLAADALVADGVDFVFTPTDNTVMAAELSIYETFANAGIPHFGGADSFALNGAFLGYGVNYELLGIETAEMIAELLLDGKKISEMPVRTFDNGIATLNTETLAALGLDLDTVKTAIAPYCTGIVELTTAENF